MIISLVVGGFGHDSFCQSIKSFEEMISAPHIPFSVKKFKGPRVDDLMPADLETEEDTISLILKEPSGEDAYHMRREKKLSDIQGQFHRDRFKEWRMPEQSTGYLKAKNHGLL